MRLQVPEPLSMPGVIIITGQVELGRAIRASRQSRDGAARPALSAHGAGEGIRTPDPLITNQMLYQLSYAGLR